jgi:RNA polymerase sigma-70 factor (ECF subfamily)
LDQLRLKLDWFRTVILTHQRALRARLRQMTGSDNELDDLCAEVLARAYATPNWRNIEFGRAFLFEIARNLIIDDARRRKIVAFETIADLDLLQAGPDVEAQLVARDELRRLQTIVEQLPPQARRAFLLRRVQEKSLGEIAEEMNLSVSTVEKHLAKAVLFVMQAVAKLEDKDFDGFRSGTARTGGDRRDGRASVRQAKP